jgi:Mrp family chromosome partitioning ATPase
MLPQVIFVLGKGGVGRSTVATALAAGLARRGGRVLIAQWAIADAISPWFGRAPTGFVAQAIAPNLATKNFTLTEAFEQYLVEHLHARAFYRTVVSNRHVRRAIAAAPGLAELMFLGNLMAVTTIERSCDRVIVDAPAMGHGASLLAMPRVTRALDISGLLAIECERVAAMLADPARSAAIVVTTPDELAVEETLEFWPQIARELGRPPLAAVINFSGAPLGALPADPRACMWLAPLSPPPAVLSIYTRLAQRAGRERVLADRLAGAPLGTFAIADAAFVDDAPTPHSVITHATTALARMWQ